MRVRRTVYAFLRLEDAVEVDVAALFRGTPSATPQSRIVADSVLTGATTAVARWLLPLLGDRALFDWTSAAELAARHGADADDVRSLVHSGVLVGDADDPDVAALRARDEALRAAGWEPHAALYHFLNKWKDVKLEQPDPATVERFLDVAGPPPPHFHTIADAQSVHTLPQPRIASALGEALRRRKTTRAFDPDATLSVDALSQLLYLAFGCHGYEQIAPGVVNLRRTSPSGGSLHPIEVYPLLIRCEGLECGLYHYRLEDHALERLERLDTSTAAELAAEFAAWQEFARAAAALFVLTARFKRTYWKYPVHPRAYTVVNMDAAHLSQTFYLVCAELGLGAFVTAAINGANIEQRLRLDPVEEGAVALLGCGAPGVDDRGLEPRFRRFVPGETHVG